MKTKDIDMKISDETVWERDFRILKRQVEETGLTKVNLSYFLYQLSGVFILEVIGFLILYYFGSSWIPYVGAGLCFALSQTQALWLQHDFGHGSVSHSKTMNQLAEHLIYCHMKGLSTSCRNTFHKKHHREPHIHKVAPDDNMDMGTFVFKLLLLPAWTAWTNFEFMIQRHAVVEIILALTFYGKLVYCLSPVLGGAMGAFGMFVFVRTIETHWYIWCGRMVHNASDDSNERGNEWIIRQLNSSTDLKSNAFIDWLTGSHSYEIEHHLFPSVPRHNLHLVAPMVQKMCKQHGLIYNQKDMMSAFSDNARDIIASPMSWIDSVKYAF